MNQIKGVLNTLQDDYQIAGSWAQNYRDHLVDLTLSDDDELVPGADLENTSQQVTSLTDIQIKSSDIHSANVNFSLSFTCQIKVSLHLFWSQKMFFGGYWHVIKSNKF